MPSRDCGARTFSKSSWRRPLHLSLFGANPFDKLQAPLRIEALAYLVCTPRMLPGHRMVLALASMKQPGWSFPFTATRLTFKRPCTFIQSLFFILPYAGHAWIHAETAPE